jgi:soluble lytic murein transglycosylase-like protein
MMNLAVMLLTLFISSEVLADTYKFVDSNGLTYYTNMPRHSFYKHIINHGESLFLRKNVLSIPDRASSKNQTTPKALGGPAVLSVSKATQKWYNTQHPNRMVRFCDTCIFTMLRSVKTHAQLLSGTTRLASRSAWYSSKNDTTKINNFNGAHKKKFAELIEQAAYRHQVDAKLVHAVIQTESAYNSSAQSPKGAVGLMQLMPDTARRFGVTDRNDPDQNVDGGTRYLKYLINLFNPNIDLAVAAYNAGENAVIRYNNSIPPYPETQNYVKQVLALYNH